MSDTSDSLSSDQPFDLTQAMNSVQAALAEDRLDEVESLCHQILSHQKGFPAANFMLAVVAHRQGDAPLAINRLKSLVQSNPSAFEAIEMLANLLREQGELGESLYLCSHMIRVQPTYPGGPALMGLCFLDQGELLKALDCMKRAVFLGPTVPAFQFHLGRILEQLRRIEDAEAAYLSAIELGPDQVMVYETLGRMLFLEGQKTEGLGYLQKAVELAPSMNGLVLLASGLTENGRHREAEHYFKQAIEIDPNYAKSHELLGYALQILGRFDEAEASLSRALELDPSLIRAYLELTTSRRITDADRPFVTQLQGMVDTPSLGKDDLRLLHYALGKSFSDLGEYETAMLHYDLANDFAFISQLKRVPYDLTSHQKWTDGILKSFTKEFFKSHRDLGSEDDSPVFILGMIRSGTTLTEQVLTSHPQIAPADELLFWTEPKRMELARNLMEGQVARHKLLATAKQYLELLGSFADDKLRVTDKMPRNYASLGLIHLLFPKARIIHCRRNPIDTCLSIYTTPFGKGAEFCYNRQSIVDAYGDYLRLMEHWRKVIPADRFMEIDYEDLVANEEEVSRKMIAFCGLEWDEACLRPEDNLRSVNTPSLWQVRQPIYTTSVERWRRYEPWLREFATLVPST